MTTTTQNAPKNLLGSGNFKTLKSFAKLAIRTFTLSLLPHLKGLGDNLCPFAGTCAKPCLESAGRGQMQSVINARALRTDMLNNDTEAFRPVLIAEYDRLQRLASRDKIAAPDIRYAVRPNTLSDIRWEQPKRPGQSSLAFGPFADPIDYRQWPDVQFYCYSKFPRSWFANIAPNYDVTYSDRHPLSAPKDATERRRLADYLATGERVATCLTPKAYSYALELVSMGDLSPFDFTILDGDEHDARFVEPSALVCLKFKGSKAKLDATTFPRNLESFKQLLADIQNRHSLFA